MINGLEDEKILCLGENSSKQKILTRFLGSYKYTETSFFDKERILLTYNVASREYIHYEHTLDRCTIKMHTTNTNAETSLVSPNMHNTHIGSNTIFSLGAFCSIPTHPFMHFLNFSIHLAVNLQGCNQQRSTTPHTNTSAWYRNPIPRDRVHIYGLLCEAR